MGEQLRRPLAACSLVINDNPGPQLQEETNGTEMSECWKEQWPFCVCNLKYTWGDNDEMVWISRQVPDGGGRE